MHSLKSYNILNVNTNVIMDVSIIQPIVHIISVNAWRDYTEQFGQSMLVW